MDAGVDDQARGAEQLLIEAHEVGRDVRVGAHLLAFYATFTRKPIADAHASSQVLLCISCESPAEVDRITEAAASAGGKADVAPKQEMGVMYGRSFEDPDGHTWEPMWMDPEFAEKGAHPVEQAEVA